jgi:phage tail sheath protein FI
MPEYLAPGVFIEETSFRSKSIEGVGTSVASIVGPTRTGPLRGTPEVVTSFAEFERVYGDTRDLVFAGAAMTNHTAIGARAFFDNGGKQLYVARVVRGGNESDPAGNGSTAMRSSRTPGNGAFTLRARHPGAWGNLWLELRYRDSENLLQFAATATPPTTETVMLTARNVASEAFLDLPAVGALDAARYPVSITGEATRSVEAVPLPGTGTRVVYTIAAGRVAFTDRNGDPVAEAALSHRLLVSALPADHRLVRVGLRTPAAGAIAAGTPAVLQFNGVTDLAPFATGWGDRTTLHGTLDAAGTQFTATQALNPARAAQPGLPALPALAADVVIPLVALAANAGQVSFLMVQRQFDIDVRTGRTGEVVATIPGIDTALTGESALSTRLPVDPQRRSDRTDIPVTATIAPAATADQIATGLRELFDAAAQATVEGPRWMIELTGGSDGEAPDSGDYAGETDETIGSTGLASFEEIEDISIVITPAAAADPVTHVAVVMEVQKHCQRMRYRIGIVDAEDGQSLNEVRALRNNFNDTRLALYYPWVVIADPNRSRRELATPPAGFVAGIYARNDVERGVHKAPANEPVLGALRFTAEINRFQQELLNPSRVNVLRSFAGRGHLVWGARTLSGDSEWMYVNVRRYFLYLERSIEKAMQWAVFEPNGDLLWANVRDTVDGFLFNEWSNNRMLGADPKQAYFVRCDRSTMTQNDLDNGRLVCEIGVAPLRPAEFVVFRIGQKTADAR